VIVSAALGGFIFKHGHCHLISLAVIAAALLVGGRHETAHAGQACTTNASPANAAAKIGAAPSGSTICLDAGVFRGRLIVAGKSGVTIRGAGTGTIVAGGAVDGIVIVDSANIVVEDLKLFMGNPANVYVARSRGVVLQRLDIGAGNIGVHVDDSSEATISDSFIYAMSGDGVLSRRSSVTTVQRSWIFINRGAGVSSVEGPGPLSLVRDIVSDNGGPGVFVGGVPPCAGLPGASLAVPSCFLANPGAYVGTASLNMDSNVVQSNGSTGIVLFPGTVATMRNTFAWRNHMTGLFAWGAYITIDGADYAGNEEHAVEVRGYPDPGAPGAGYVAGSATITNADIHNTVPYPPTGTLGGGVLAQGTSLFLTNSRIWSNAGEGASYQNGATGSVDGNAINFNGGGALCLSSAGYVAIGANTIFGNGSDQIGAC
jgi:Right handed beta helix region